MRGPLTGGASGPVSPSRPRLAEAGKIAKNAYLDFRRLGLDVEKSGLSGGTEVAGAVFWTLVFGLVMVADILDDLASSGPHLYADDALLAVFAVVVFAMAALIRKGNRLGSLVSIAVGAFFVLATLAADGLDTPDAYTGTLLVFVGLLAIYANYLSFIRMRKIKLTG